MKKSKIWVCLTMAAFLILGLPVAPTITVENSQDNALVTIAKDEAKRVVNSRFPYFSKAHSHIIDKLRYRLPLSSVEEGKCETFMELADELFDAGLQFLDNWSEDDAGNESLTQINELYVEDGLKIKYRYADYLIFSNTITGYSLGHKISKKKFVSYTFLEPSIYYYLRAKSYSPFNERSVYDQQIVFVLDSYNRYFAPPIVPYIVNRCDRLCGG